jgi:AhpD family alkylhydroperoxidase
MTSTATREEAAVAGPAVRLDVDSLSPGYLRAMTHLDHAAIKELDRVDFDPALRELVRLRASQINGCAYCVDLHSRDARALGEVDARIAAISVWRESPFFSARERAALAFTESVTMVATTHVPDADFDAVRDEFSEAEVAALLALVVTINAWNALSVASRAWSPALAS